MKPFIISKSPFMKTGMCGTWWCVDTTEGVSEFSSYVDAEAFIKAWTPKADDTRLEGFQQKTKTIAEGITAILTEKNKRYGNSALNPINVFTGKSKVGQRADDKLARLKNSEVLRKNDVADLIGYLFLICHENDWTDFTDQID